MCNCAVGDYFAVKYIHDLRPILLLSLSGSYCELGEHPVEEIICKLII